MQKVNLPTPTNVKPNIALIILASVYILFLLMSSVFINCIVLVPGNTITTAAAFYFPLTFVISDIVVEIYGYKVARALIWSGLLCQFLFALFAKLTISIHEPAMSTTANFYRPILGNLLPIFISAFIASFIADFINVYALSKLKLLMKGRNFALRSICCNLVGSFIFTTICVSSIYYHEPIKRILEIGTSIYFIKIIYAGVFAFPAAFIAHLIKTKCNYDAYDYLTNFNPFKVFDVG